MMKQHFKLGEYRDLLCQKLRCSLTIFRIWLASLLAFSSHLIDIREAIPGYSTMRATLAFVFAVSLLAPQFALAQAEGRALRPEGASINFCTRVAEVTAKVSGGIADREAKYQTKRGEQRTKLNDRFATRDLKRSEHRSAWDGKRDEWRTKLSERATTPEQKAAVEQFVKDMDTAIATRRSAVDVAVKQFRAGVDAAVVARQSAVDGAIATLKTETEAAVAKAKSDCGSGVAPKTAREAYVQALKNAREKFRTTVKALEARKDTLLPLADARKIAIEKAVADFKAQVEKAKSDLKKVFP